ncbi:antitoxin VbhA family protein [Sporosarcina saromensis]|uniref:Antitoxin VbhA family protein n=1 Tax=Sporosarcina saromensis TaxID=359365 RepID=A0ABU4GDK4_9BACL|nr:antitoxin VbhA family protein [Sporosarcina saromensis]MDW0115050.1 antitoxin VbhA family protein [Sporosarcina saromensis]
MQEESRFERRKKVQFAVGMAAIDGGKPSAFTKKLLEQYENGHLTSSELKQAIVKKYTRASQ